MYTYIYIYVCMYIIFRMHYTLFLFKSAIQENMMNIKKLTWILVNSVLFLIIRGEDDDDKGRWHLLLNSTGVVGMHMVLTRHNTVVIFDQSGADQGRYQLRRRYNGTRCKCSRVDLADSSCYAHSVEYSISSNQIRPLNLETDTWCSSGSVLSTGTILQTGGSGDGYRRIRYYEPCIGETCDWRQSSSLLSNDRWYSSNLLLPENDRVIIVGGRGEFSYEFVPKYSHKEKAIDLPFLHETYERRERGNNLYPILHLSSDGNLFIFANRDSILFDYKQNTIVKKFPRIPGDGSRSYPSTGSSVILPIEHSSDYKKVEVMVCGGASKGAYSSATKGRLLEGLKSCGRMVITGKNHKWTMELMPSSRIMSDMLILPTGSILIINGVERGCAGWHNAEAPSLEPFLYKPKKELGNRFTELKSTKIARMYHSTAILLPDGRVLVAGSNPNDRYALEGVKYPTELRLQAFLPPYMDEKHDSRTARNLSVIYTYGHNSAMYGDEFVLQFNLEKKLSNPRFSAYAPPFNTHSLSMNQRLIMLRIKRINKVSANTYNATLEAPPSANIAPAGYYLITVINAAVPSISQWVKFTHG